MSTNYEPSAEAVAALAKALHDEMYQDCTYNEKGVLEERLNYAARFVLRRQHERERRLLAGIVRAQEWLSVGSMDTAQHELSETRVWYNKLDAPKVPEAPTLLEAAKAMLRYPAHEHCERWLALEAAVEREEKR